MTIEGENPTIHDRSFLLSLVEGSGFDIERGRYLEIENGVFSRSLLDWYRVEGAFILTKGYRLRPRPRRTRWIICPFHHLPPVVAHIRPQVGFAGLG